MVKKKTKKRSKFADDRELKYASQKLYAVTDMITTITTSGFKYGSLVAIMYFAYLSIASLSGQETVANIAMNLLAEIKVNEYVAYIFGGVGTVYGLGERKLRKKRTKELAEQLEKCEEQVNPDRQSSGLTHRGETNPEDSE